MQNLDALLDGLLAKEGSYSNDPNDPGGETKWGITKITAMAAGYLRPMEDLTRDQAKQIYTKQYWVNPGFDKLDRTSSAIASELFDTSVNMGVQTAIRYLQRGLTALGANDLTVDGQLGPRTLTALEEYLDRRGGQGETVMLRILNSLQGASYVTQSEQNPAVRGFVFGWFANRVS